MASEVARNRKLWIAGHDLTGDFNALAVDDGVELREATAFGDSGRRRRAGVFGPALEGEGYQNLDVGAVDEVLVSQLALEDVPITVGGEEGGVEGQVAYLFRAMWATYRRNAPHGDMAGFSVSAEGSAGGRLVRGVILRSSILAGASTFGPILQLGQVPAGKSLQLALHVLAVGGSPAITVQIDSDDAVGFPSATGRVTFDVVTAVGSQWKTLAGPVTDDWWRARITAGSTGTATFIVSAGIV